MSRFNKTPLFFKILVAIISIVFLYILTSNLGDAVYGSYLSLVPAFVSITLALITKEVYSSLFFGIVVGALIFSDFSFVGTFIHVFNDGLVAVLTNHDNLCIIIFLILLGSIVSLMHKSGATDAFGTWALKHIKNKRQAQLATFALGVLIFIDDTFNCLTVGNVMRSITDKFKVSREKLAYLIDSTAAPICIIAPISSWAAAIAGFVHGGDGFITFVRTIPYNFYALFTIVMVLSVIVMDVDFGPMLDAELLNAKIEKRQVINKDHKGTVLDLILPIVALIIFCTLGILYTGNFFTTYNFFEAFSNANAGFGLMYGSFLALVFTIMLYVVRNVVDFNSCMDSITEGFKIMVPAIIILSLAWTLKAMSDSLGSTEFVKALIGSKIDTLALLMPAFMFAIGAIIAFATGTSWGTFGILIPMVINVFALTNDNMMIIAIAACMAGSVCGDHCSPISDTTIMASSGAEANHIAHVTTQLPYVLMVAIISLIAYILVGFIDNVLVILTLGTISIIAILYLIKRHQKSHM